MRDGLTYHSCDFWSKFHLAEAFDIVESSTDKLTPECCVFFVYILQLNINIKYKIYDIY